ncbi:hypothetical protein [uncultured Sphaerochaeta sp.]|uniref:hypothetical protein n=1 Tax=uncultured Sphaerochaeta sp. TaxID=886478 RepID=UPI0029C9D0BD|nr:hypothetical protein [uncultured Sphaerochaeta sp.]
MNRQWTISLMIAIGIAVFAMGCSMEAVSPEGSLVIQVQEAMTRNIFESTNTLTGDGMNIKGYKITLTQGGVIRGISGLVYHRKADGSPIVLEALEPGLWGLEIAGYNGWNDTTKEVSGEQIAYLRPKEDTHTSQGYIEFSIQRGKITTISSAEAVLVPVRSFSGGALDIVVDWSALNSVDEQKLYNNPDVSVKVTQINDRFSNYPTMNWDDASNASVTTETKVGTLDAGGTSSTISFAALPVGWYEVVATLASSSTENSSVTQLKRMGYVRVIDDYEGETITTTGTFTITDATSFATGSLDLSISEDMDPLTMSFTEIGSPECINYPNTDGFGDMAFGSFEVEATGADSANTLSYAWYVNGELVSAQTAASMACFFEEAGQYTITAIVYETTTDGSAVNWGSASHEVVVGYELGTKELLNVSVVENPTDTYEVTVTDQSSNSVTDLTYVWYNDLVLTDATGTSYTGTYTEGLVVFAYELDDNGILTRWGSEMYSIGYN